MGAEARKINALTNKNELTTSEAREKFADLIERVHFNKERVVLLRRGKKAVAIIPIEDLELLEEFEAEEDQQDLLAMEEALKEQKDDPLVSWQEVKTNAGIK